MHSIDKMELLQYSGKYIDEAIQMDTLQKQLHNIKKLEPLDFMQNFQSLALHQHQTSK